MDSKSSSLSVLGVGLNIEVIRNLVVLGRELCLPLINPFVPSLNVGLHNHFSDQGWPASCLDAA